jgi:hypothetical protein
MVHGVTRKLEQQSRSRFSTSRPLRFERKIAWLSRLSSWELSAGGTCSWLEENEPYCGGQWSKAYLRGSKWRCSNLQLWCCWGTRSIFGGSKGVRVFGQLNLDHFWPKFEPGSIGWHYHQSFRVSWKSCSQGLKETEPILGVACPRRVQEAHIGGGPASSRDWGVVHGWKTGGTEVY